MQDISAPTAISAPTLIYTPRNIAKLEFSSPIFERKAASQLNTHYIYIYILIVELYIDAHI